MDLMTMFRLPKDYLAFLSRSGALQTVVSSVLSLHWLCLERYMPGHAPFSQAYKSSVHLAKNKSLAEERHLDRLSSHADFPYFQFIPSPQPPSDLPAGLTDYFLEIKLSHPISDKVFQNLTYAGSLVKQLVGPSPSYLSDADFLVDVSDFSYLCTNFMGKRELFVPQTVCLIHLDLFLPTLTTKQGFSALICLPEDVHHEPLYRGRKPNQFIINLQMSETTRIALLFKDYEVEGMDEESNFETFTNLGHTRSGDYSKFQRVRGFCLIEFCLSICAPSGSTPARGQNSSLHTANHLESPFLLGGHGTVAGNYSQHCYLPDTSPRRTVQERHHGNSGYNSGYHNGRSSHFPYDRQQSEGVVPSFFTNGPRDFDAYGPPVQAKGHFSHSNKHQHGSPKTQVFTGKPKADPQRINHPQTLARQGSNPSKPARKPSSPSSSSKEEADIEITETDKIVIPKETVISDPKAFKAYANSKRKSPFLLNLLTEIKSEDHETLLTTLEPIIKDICNNKYGNYLAQKLVRSIPPSKLERFIALVVCSYAARAPRAGHRVPPEGHIRSSGHR